MPDVLYLAFAGNIDNEGADVRKVICHLLDILAVGSGTGDDCAGEQQ